MKGYEDVVATLTVLAIVLLGGYIWLDYKAKQQEILQAPSAVEKAVPKAKVAVEKKQTFEMLVKRTD